MISGNDLRDARVRAGLTQEQLGVRLHVTLRSVGNWERSSVPANKEALVRDLLADQLGGGSINPLHEISDVALLAEVGRRMEAARNEGGNRMANELRRGVGNPDVDFPVGVSDVQGKMQESDTDGYSGGGISLGPPPKSKKGGPRRGGQQQQGDEEVRPD